MKACIALLIVLALCLVVERVGSGTLTATSLNATTMNVGPRTIDDRISGLTASNSTQLLYSTQDHTTPTYVRSTTCWARGINLTCVSPWNSGNANLWAGTAITPRHIVHAQHAFVQDTATIRFIAMDGTVVTRTVSSGMQVGTTDLRISVLDSDLPASITPAKVLPDDWASHFDETRAPTIVFNQEERVSVADILHITAGGDVNGDDIRIQIPVDEQRLEFHFDRILNDSGNPVFLLINNEPVLLFCFKTTVYGPTLIQDNRAAVVAAINTLGAFGHSLTDYEF
jgi:hypothetical protein